MLLLALALQTAVKTDDCQRISNGPAIGLCGGEIVKGTGGDILKVRASGDPTPPLPAEVAPKVAVLLDAYDKAHDFPADSLAPGATASFFPDFLGSPEQAGPARRWSVPVGLSRLPPYPLPDGRVRIARTREGKIVYLSFLRFTDGRLSEIRTAPAEFAMRSPG